MGTVLPVACRFCDAAACGTLEGPCRGCFWNGGLSNNFSARKDPPAKGTAKRKNRSAGRRSNPQGRRA